MRDVDGVRIGRIVRALRHRRGWTQCQLGDRVGCSGSVVSRVERGHLDACGLRTLEAMVRLVDARLVLSVQWRGGELDALLDAAHAMLRERWARRRRGWVARAEVTYSEWGERGAIDELAFHPATGTLLVVELKTVIADTQGVLARLDAKARLARGIAHRFGWRAVRVVPCLVVADTRTNRRRIGAHPAAFDGLSLRGPAAQRWLSAPVDGVDGALLFESVTNLRGTHVRQAGRQRIRHRRTDPSVGAMPGRAENRGASV